MRRRLGALAALALLPVSGHAKAQPGSDCAADLTPQFILRQDFTDVPTLGCGAGSASELPLAVGARASYTYDDIHNISGMSADGLAAVDFRYSIPNADRYLSNVSFGPFAQFAGMHNFASATSPPSSLGSATTGAFVQFFVEVPVETRLRIRGGETMDTTGVRDGSAVGEFIPAFELSEIFGEGLPGNLSHFLFGAEFDVAGLKTILTPEVEAQYDSYQSGPRSYALFASRLESMRVGPLVVLKLYGFEKFAAADTVYHDILSKLAISATYHAAWDAFSMQRYYNFQPALIINVGEKGNYAITTSYSIGDSETSGNRMRQVKVAFAAKF